MFRRKEKQLRGHDWCYVCGKHKKVWEKSGESNDHPGLGNVVYHKDLDAYFCPRHFLKFCIMCGETKTLLYFHNNCGSSDGTNSRCKTCNGKYTEKVMNGIKDRLSSYQKPKIKEELNEYLKMYFSKDFVVDKTKKEDTTCKKRGNVMGLNLISLDHFISVNTHQLSKISKKSKEKLEEIDQKYWPSSSVPNYLEKDDVKNVYFNEVNRDINENHVKDLVGGLIETEFLTTPIVLIRIYDNNKYNKIYINGKEQDIDTPIYVVADGQHRLISSIFYKKREIPYIYYNDCDLPNNMTVGRYTELMNRANKQWSKKDKKEVQIKNNDQFTTFMKKLENTFVGGALDETKIHVILGKKVSRDLLNRLTEKEKINRFEFVKSKMKNRTKTINNILEEIVFIYNSTANYLLDGFVDFLFEYNLFNEEHISDDINLFIEFLSNMDYDELFSSYNRTIAKVPQSKTTWRKYFIYMYDNEYKEKK